MTMVDMSHFMNKDFPPVFLQVFPADDNILHPTERSYLLIVHHKCNPFLQLLMFAGMYQPEETNQRIDIATEYPPDRPTEQSVPKIWPASPVLHRHWQE